MLLYGSEIWTISTKNILNTNLKTAEIKFTATPGYNLLDLKRNEDILEELEIVSMENKIHNYKSNWCNHVLGIGNTRIQKLKMSHKSKGQRRPGRSLRILLNVD